MKIQICGSMTFAKQMAEAKKTLQKAGHTITVPTNTDLHIQDASFVDDLSGNFQHCIDNDTIRANFKLVADADAILVMNYPKNGIDGYIGASTLMELGIAHYFDKKIFLLFPVPHYDMVRWAHEVAIMQPTLINGNLELIA